MIKHRKEPFQVSADLAEEMGSEDFALDYLRIKEATEDTIEFVLQYDRTNRINLSNHETESD